ncbi:MULTISPECIES: hypothetical protein [unclassified Streptomyces]|uniref:Transcriptional regulator n=1 Tax=Streptomyces sp. NBC_00060 TaxID=2975636 RepID=A0AAU2GRL2_9ACTN
MMQHPLAALRASAGITHPAYARLVADTHAELGYGPMAARREKVSRWESGGTVPELTAQLAIAHIHQVPEHEVRRLGWPHWLHLAAGDSALLTRPWDHSGAIEALRAEVQRADRHGPSHLALSGPFVHALAEQWRTAAKRSTPARATGAHRTLAGTTEWARARVEGLGRMTRTVSPAVLYPAARSDLSLLTTFLSGASYDSRTSGPLFLLAARVASLCAGLAISLGETAGAERHYLVAARAAMVAGKPEISAAYLAGVAYTHLLEGKPQDALCLIDAAQSALHRPGHHVAAILHLLGARAHALLGEAASCARSLDRAGAALAALATGHRGKPCPLQVVEMHLAAGEVAAAAQGAGPAVSLCDVSAKVIRRYEERFAAHSTGADGEKTYGRLVARR